LLSLGLTSRRAPRPTLLPYTTLFRSHTGPHGVDALALRGLAECIVGVPDRVSNLAGQDTSLRFVHRGNDGDPASVVPSAANAERSEEHTSELQSRENLVCRLLLEKIN